MQVSIAISEAEFGLHQKPRMLRGLFKSRYPVNLHSGKPIAEFVELADCCAKLGVAVVPHSKMEHLLQQGRPIAKLGKTNLAQDLGLLACFPNDGSEWNRRNLETIGDFNHHLDLGRLTWNLFLGQAEHQQKLQELFHAHGRLFIKTVTKGHARVYGAFDEFMNAVGDVSRLAEESLDLLVSEVMEMRQIQADTPEGTVERSDEWRHHVYRQRLVCTTHAFDCNAHGTDDSGLTANVAKARTAIEQLRTTAFATTYVLDTCTLTDGSATVVETNNFFASGIYDPSAIRAIAEAISGSNPGATP